MLGREPDYGCALGAPYETFVAPCVLRFFESIDRDAPGALSLACQGVNESYAPADEVSEQWAAAAARRWASSQPTAPMTRHLVSVRDAQRLAAGGLHGSRWFARLRRAGRALCRVLAFSGV